MDVREKLVELLKSAENQRLAASLCCTVDELVDIPKKEEYVAEYLIAHGVMVQEWISVKDRLPERNEDGTLNAVLVTNGCIQHIAYFARDEFYFTENGEMKEPMFYDVTHWQPLPQPPKGE